MTMKRPTQTLDRFIRVTQTKPRVMQSETVRDEMMKIAEIRITEAVWPEDRVPIARLMREYVETLDADISFQDFESEYAVLPGKYARPEGVVLIGWMADEAVGIVAYRPLEHRICEMKRLYVSPRFRGTGLGRLLVEELVREARSHGYRRMVLDTLPSMRPAQALYSAMGFRPIPAYYDNPLPGVIYMALEL
jgi:putative acetyltransferase